MKTEGLLLFLVQVLLISQALGGTSNQQPLGENWPALGGNTQQKPTNNQPPLNGWAALSYGSQPAPDLQSQQNWPLPGQEKVQKTSQTSTTTTRPTTNRASTQPNWAGVVGNQNQGHLPRPATTQPSRPRTTSRSNSSPESKITDAELATFAENAFKKDTNNAFQHVTIDLQGRVPQTENGDSAPNKLLKVNESGMQRSPTIEKLRLLYNNYELDSSVNEYVTPIERKEESDFLDAVLTTPVMRYTMQLLQQKGVVTADPKTHKDLLRTIWFNTYSRGQGKIGSSGFEHVFLSEIKNGTLTGLHNWLYFLEEEKHGNVDYKGYSKDIKLGNKGEIVKMRFCRKEICKPTTSMLVGSSPELEMALYTTCFELRPNADCPLTYAGKTFTVKTHTFRYRGKQLVGSAFIQV